MVEWFSLPEGHTGGLSLHGSWTKMVTNHESQTFISVFKSHNQHVNYRFLILFLRKEKSAKRVPEKQLKSG